MAVDSGSHLGDFVRVFSRGADFGHVFGYLLVGKALLVEQAHDFVRVGNHMGPSRSRTGAPWQFGVSLFRAQNDKREESKTPWVYLPCGAARIVSLST